MNYSLVDLGAGQFELSGELDLSNVGDALLTGQNQFVPYDSISIDLAGASCTNSAGMALLLEWSTWCSARGKQLYYVAVPGRLFDLARLNDVEQLLRMSAG